MTAVPVYSIVVPVFQASGTLAPLVDRLSTVFEATGDAFEILLIDDGSDRAETLSALRALEQHDSVRVVHLMRNFGKGAAVLCGFSRAKGQWVITLDDDLQHAPEDLPRLLEHRHHDVVVGVFTKKHHGWLARIGSAIKSQFDRRILRLRCPMSPVKLIRASVAKAVLQIRTPHPFLPALLGYVTQDFVGIEIGHSPSSHGPSRYTFSRRLRQLSHLVISNSSILLRWTGCVGVGISSIAFLYAIWIVLRKILGQPIQSGWATLVVINLVFGGFLLIISSIIGEYLIRILDGTTDRPSFFVREDSEVIEPASERVSE